ncbi:MAG TPA: hypothetical protein VKY92_08785 [Verrucomicrobiae bacterium]|nr:hypothetical protein [Verrucomicrobiae bacterium]
MFVLPMLLAVLASCVFCSGCSRQREAVVTKGVILSVSYKDADGKTHGFTRLNQASAVPGGNGSWNVDAYGRLTPHFLIITRPQRRDLGPLVIPVRNLVEVQFGDGGIKNISENSNTAATSR